MAIFHYSAQIIGRSAGRSAVACAAYRAGEKLQCRETGTVKDYTRKDRVYRKYILAPKGAPEWAYSREELWNHVHAVEKRKDAQLCREVNVALPRELKWVAQVELVRRFVQREFVDRGMVADVCCHNLEGDNPHAHIMLSTRVLTPEGFGKKERAWNDRKMLLQQREAWARCCNGSLAMEWLQESVDHRSLKEQGLDREPEIHLGSKPHPERVARLEEIRERNRTRQNMKRELRSVVSDLSVETRRERALEEQAKAERDRAAYLAYQKNKEERLRKEAQEQEEKRARTDEFLRSLGVRSSFHAKEERKDVARKLGSTQFHMRKKEREFSELEEQKGRFSFLKNRRLTVQMNEIAVEYEILEKREQEYQKRVGQLDKAYEILWERERPAREAREREYAQEQAEREREQRRIDALDPRYEKVLRQYDVTLGKRIDFKKQLAAAPDDQARDRMLAEWEHANQKNLSRGRGR